MLKSELAKWSPEWEIFNLLEKIKHPGKNATHQELYNYWVDMRDLAKIALNAAVKAALIYGEANGKELNND